MDVLDKVGERINQTSGYGERLLDGGLTKGHPMKLEVAGRNRLGWSVWRGQHLTNHPLTMQPRSSLLVAGSAVVALDF